MDKVKSAVGIGGKDQEGQEPVSGREGEGTVGQPFDAGNDAGANATTAAEPTAASTTTTGEQQSTTEAIVDKGKKAVASGGGWFKNPFSKGDENQAEPTGTEPNSTSTISPPAMSDPVKDENIESNAAPVKALVMNNENTAPQPTSTAPPQSNGKQPAMNFPPSSDWVNQPRDGPRMSSLKSSRAFSVSSPAADKSRRDPIKADNPSRIPSAGGVALGSRAAEDRERRRSMMPTHSSEMPMLDKAGSPDAVTQNNTVANTVPATAHDNGEGSSKMAGSGVPDIALPGEAGQTVPPVTADAVPKETTANGAATNPAAATTPAVTTNPTAAAATSPPPPVASGEAGKKADAAAAAANPEKKHERRASKLDGLKGLFSKKK